MVLYGYAAAAAFLMWMKGLEVCIGLTNLQQQTQAGLVLTNDKGVSHVPSHFSRTLHYILV